MKKKKKFSIGAFFFRLSCVFTAIVVTVALVMTVLLAVEWKTEDAARYVPDYEKIDLTELLEKDVWTDEDYETLYYQTGLAREPLDELKTQPSRILNFQDAFFYEGKIVHILAAPTTPHEVLLGKLAPFAPLKDGDVIVTSTCHTYGWRNGHAAIVANAKTESILQSVAPGRLSHTESMAWFQSATNFIILRMKDLTEEERTQIGSSALEHLNGIPYSLTVGIFSKKDQGFTPEATHCSHLVWQAYKNFGYDIDSDGGPVVTSNDIANCPLFEVVQVYGFHPDQLWK